MRRVSHVTVAAVSFAAWQAWPVVFAFAAHRDPGILDGGLFSAAYVVVYYALLTTAVKAIFRSARYSGARHTGNNIFRAVHETGLKCSVRMEDRTLYPVRYGLLASNLALVDVADGLRNALLEGITSRSIIGVQVVLFGGRYDWPTQQDASAMVKVVNGELWFVRFTPQLRYNPGATRVPRMRLVRLLGAICDAAGIAMPK